MKHPPPKKKIIKTKEKNHTNLQTCGHGQLSLLVPSLYISLAFGGRLKMFTRLEYTHNLESRN